jgi:hypothetical protein
MDENTKMTTLTGFVTLIQTKLDRYLSFGLYPVNVPHIIKLFPVKSIQNPFRNITCTGVEVIFIRTGD